MLHRSSFGKAGDFEMCYIQEMPVAVEPTPELTSCFSQLKWSAPPYVQ